MTDFVRKSRLVKPHHASLFLSLDSLMGRSNKTNFIQISDCHLFKDDSTILLGLNTHTSFTQVLADIKKQTADFILATGDLTQDEPDAVHKRTQWDHSQHARDDPSCSAALLALTLVKSHHYHYPPQGIAATNPTAPEAWQHW